MKRIDEKLTKKYKPLNVKVLWVIWDSPLMIAGKNSLPDELLRLAGVENVAATVPLRIGFAPFVMDDMLSPSPHTPAYYSATFKDGAWQVSEAICKAGEFMAKNVRDGAQTYLGGMAYYYGVGEAGLTVNGQVDTETNKIYIARFDGEYRVIESYKSVDGGRTYTLEQVIRKIPADKNIKTWRPTVPVHAQDNMPLYWHEGKYEAHTGGWHCDVVAYVEFDE